MSDPRVERTRAHVLETLHAILAAGGGANLTFSALAAEAKVSRRTLYTHWGTVGNLLVDALEQHPPPVAVSLGSAPENLRSYLLMISERLNDPVVSSALLALLAQESHIAGSHNELKELRRRWLERFTISVAPATHEQFAQLVSPVLVQAVMGEPRSQELIGSLVERGTTILRLA